MALTYTLEFAVALTLVNLWLSIRVVQVRLRTNTLSGTGGHPLMEARSRAHSNFSEYIPMALILMGLVELHAGSVRPLFWLGAALVVGRVMHPFGMERPAPNVFRMGGMALTMLSTVALTVWGALILYGRA